MMLVPTLCISQNGTITLKDIKPLDVIVVDTQQYILLTPSMLKEVNLLIARHSYVEMYADTLEQIIVQKDKDIATIKELVVVLERESTNNQKLATFFREQNEAQKKTLRRERIIRNSLIGIVVVQVLYIIAR